MADIAEGGGFGWTYGYLKKDVTGHSLDGGTKTFEAGDVVRVYTGTLPPAFTGAKVPVLMGTKGKWLVEAYPPKGGFWKSYPTNEKTKALIGSPGAPASGAFAADSEARKKRAAYTKLGSLEEALAPLDQGAAPRGVMDYEGMEKYIKPPDKGGQGEGETPVAKPGDFPWLLLAGGAVAAMGQVIPGVALAAIGVATMTKKA